MEKILVLGLGVSGRSAVEFLLRQHKHVIAYDSNMQISVSCMPGVERITEESYVDWKHIQQVVVSPGIPATHPLYQKAISYQIPLLSEVELALPHFDQTLLAVTGTNGKTTVTLLTEHVLNYCGIRAKALGNVGTSLCQYLNEKRADDQIQVGVIELSSFQLETLHVKKFDAAVLLNITPDHLDRHASMEEYANFKCRLQNCLKEDAPFYVYETAAKEWNLLLHSHQIFTYGWEADADFYMDQGAVKYRQKIEYLLPVQYREKAKHELENILGAWMLCRQFSLSPESFFAAVDTFRKPSHRIEFVKEIDGVSYFDDSKGTNIDAVIQAVNAMKGPVILIAGGVDKGASYLPWKEHFSGKVKQMIVIGQAAKKIEAELHPYFEIKHADSLSSSVQLASQLSQSGDCVLLSPGCASFDMFASYAERGKVFQQSVHSLQEERVT